MDPTDWQLHSPETMEKPPLIQDQDEIPGKIQRMNVPHCGYYSVKDNKRPHTMMGTNEELEHHTPSSDRHNMSYRLNSNTLNPEMVTSSDPDSEPEEMSEIDKELARKRRELKQIEKQILCKKTTAIALKTTTVPPLKSILKAMTPCQMTTTTRPPLKSILKAKTPCQMMFKEDREEDLSSKVDSSVRDTLAFMNTGEKDVGFSSSKQPSAYSNRPLKGFSSSKQPSAYNNRPLKERVDGIVQRRKAWRDYCTTAFSTPTDHLPPPNPVEKTSSSTLNKDDHPLKLRVKALMKRHRNSGLLDSHGEVPVKPQPPSQSPTTTVEEKNSTVKGFQRFLSVLNKGVDIEMLNKILIDDNEHPPTGQGLLHSSQTPVVKEKPVVCESDSQQDCRSRSEERKTELLDQHISNEGCKINFQREEKSAQSDDRDDHHFVSSRRSRSPPVVEEKKAKLEQHQGDLQNILKMIGFSMDADDMCKLAERTRKRLYGMKNETKQRLYGTAPSKISQQHVRSDHSRSSSSTSVSDRPSSSPSRHQHSPSKTRDSGEQTQNSEYSLHFRQRSRERGRERDGDKNIIASRDGATGRHQYLENPEYLVTYPDACAIPMYNSDAASAIPSYTSVRHRFGPASLNYGSNDIPPPSSSYPPAFSNYSMTPLCPSADTGALDGHVYPHPYLPAGCNTAPGHSHFNSDLSLIEGQSGQRPLPRDLHINPQCQTKLTDMKIQTKQPAEQIHGQESSNGKKGLDTTEQNSDLSLSEGQTGRRQSDRCYLHIINTVQHSEYTDYHRDTSNGASSAAWDDVSNDNPPSSSCPPGLCNSINPVRPSADTGALLGQVYPHPHPPAGYNDAPGHSCLNSDLSLTETEGLQGQQLEGDSECTDIIADCYRRVLRPLRKGESFRNLRKELKYIRKWIAEANGEWLQKQIAAKEQDILMILNPNSDLSLIKWKAELQTEEMKMAEQKKGQKESQRSIQGQQLDLEVSSEYIDHIAPVYRLALRSVKGRPFSWLHGELKRVRHWIALANIDPKHNYEYLKKRLAAKEQYILMILNPSSDLPLIEGQTGQQSAVNKNWWGKNTAREPRAQLRAGRLEEINKEIEEIKANLTKEVAAAAGVVNSDLSLSEGQTGQQSATNMVTKAEFQTEEMKMAEQKEGQKESQRSIQGQQLEADSECTDDIPPCYRRVLCPVRKGCRFAWLKNELKLVRKWIGLANSDPEHNFEWLQKQLAAKEQEVLMTLEEKKMAEPREGQKESQRSIQGQQLDLEVSSEFIDQIAPVYRQALRSVKGRPFSWLHGELKRVRHWIALANIDPKHNYEYLKKRLAAKEQYILMILNPSSDLPLIEGQTGQQSAVNKNWWGKNTAREPRAQLRAAHMEEIKKEIEEIKANLRKEVAAAAGVVNSDLSLSEGQTGQQSATNMVSGHQSGIPNGRNENGRTKGRTKRKSEKHTGTAVGSRLRMILQQKLDLHQNDLPPPSNNLAELNESPCSIKVEQLELELPTEEEINANLTKKVAAAGVGAGKQH